MFFLSFLCSVTRNTRIRQKATRGRFSARAHFSLQKKKKIKNKYISIVHIYIFFFSMTKFPLADIQIRFKRLNRQFLLVFMLMRFLYTPPPSRDVPLLLLLFLVSANEIYSSLRRHCGFIIMRQNTRRIRFNAVLQ